MTTPRSPLAMAVAVAVAVAVVLSCTAGRADRAEPAADAARPNVVLILADDLGWGDLQCYAEASRVPTPRLDALAGEGLRFLDAHSPSSVCSPTRYGILTGRHAWRTELTSSVVWEWGRPLLEPERTTLPELLRARGYRTACVGKWHLGWTWLDDEGEPVNADVPFVPRQSDQRRAAGPRVDFTRALQDGPLAHGFDTYFGDDVPNFPPRAFIRDDRLLSTPSDPKPEGMFGVAGPTTPGWDLAAVMPRLTEEAVAFVTEAAATEEPFFLYYPLTAPHTPIAPAPEFAGTTAAGAYGDYVAQVDATVGAVLDALEEAGCAQDTLVVFTSDNGSPARDGTGMSGAVHGVTAKHGHVPNGPWRGLKADIWEAGHRVPLLVRWPGHVPAGATTDALVGLQDLYATLAEVSGAAVAPGDGEDSRSFMTVLGRPETSGRAQLVHHALDGTFALRAGRWKLVVDNLGSGGFSAPRSMPPEDGGPGGQLYDLEADPTESENVWGERPEIVRELEQALQATRSGQ